MPVTVTFCLLQRVALRKTRLIIHKYVMLSNAVLWDIASVLFFDVPVLFILKLFPREYEISSAIRREYSTRYVIVSQTIPLLACYNKMSFYDNHYYHFNKTSMCIIGQWPFQSQLRNRAMFAVTVFFIFSLTALEVVKHTYDSNR